VSDERENQAAGRKIHRRANPAILSGVRRILDPSGSKRVIMDSGKETAS